MSSIAQNCTSSFPTHANATFGLPNEEEEEQKKPSKGIFKIITLDLEDDLLTVMKEHWIGEKGLVNRPFFFFFLFNF